MKKTFYLMFIVFIALASSGCLISGEAQATAIESEQPSVTELTLPESSVVEDSQQDAAVAAPAVSAEEALDGKSKAHDEPEDYTWDEGSVISIALNGDSASVSGDGASVEGSKVTIQSAGTYSLSGSLSDGQIVVDSEDEETVRLILNGVDIRNSSSAPVYVIKAEKVVVWLAAGTQNTLVDAASYVQEDPEEDEPNAALFSKSDLSIAGEGTLLVTGNYNDGITSKDGLVIAGGNISVEAADDGLRGKDYVVVRNGSIAVSSGGDGITSDNEEDAEKGYVAVDSGVFNITSGGDAISAQSDVAISNGEFTLTSGGGNGATIADTESAKGIKAAVNLNIDNGVFIIDSADDTLHSNGNVTINNGNFQIASGDDGIHGEGTVQINAGQIVVQKSYEGIEGASITINDGIIQVAASDDGINVAYGVDNSGMRDPGAMQQQFGAAPDDGSMQPPDGMPADGGMQPPDGMPADGGMRPQGGGNRPQGGGGMQDGGMQQSTTFSYSGSNYLTINGGYIYVNANGDGVDVNGAIQMSGGVLLVDGPTENMNGALDFDGGFEMSGGVIIAAGSSGMAMSPGAYSTQNSVMVYLDGAQAAGTIFNIQDSTGANIVTFAPAKSYQSVVVSSPDLQTGEAYTINLGGTSSGAAVDGLYQDGTYTPGTAYSTFTISETVTRVGSGGGFGRP